jgi:hypothetical protein
VDWCQVECDFPSCSEHRLPSVANEYIHWSSIPVERGSMGQEL